MSVIELLRVRWAKASYHSLPAGRWPAARQVVRPWPCRWFPPKAPVAVIFSDRLVKSGMVTVTSLCRHPTTLYVLVLMQVTPAYKPIASTFLSCRIISMTMLDALQYLRDAGWKPDTICDGPGRDTLGKVTQPTLLGAAHWDKDPKHASCANHLRFYLSEFPILAKHERILLWTTTSSSSRTPLVCTA